MRCWRVGGLENPQEGQRPGAVGRCSYQALEGIANGLCLKAHLLGAAPSVHTPEPLTGSQRLRQVLADNIAVHLLQSLLEVGARSPEGALGMSPPAPAPTPGYLGQGWGHVLEEAREGHHLVHEGLQQVLGQPGLGAQDPEERLGAERWAVGRGLTPSTH